MKKIAIILAMMLPAAAFGQSFSTGARASVCVFLKVGVGYTLINPYKINKELDNDALYTGFWAPQHRLTADVTGTLKAGKFSFSLRERLQFTHNTYDALNEYQSTRNALALKSRIGVKYKGKYVDPSLSFEVRAALNDPWGTVSGNAQTTNDTKREYYTYTHTGYTHAYINRLRLNLGADILLSKSHTLTPYVLFDYCMDYEIDTNGADKWAEKGVRIFTDSTGWVYSTALILGLKYTFSF